MYHDDKGGGGGGVAGRLREEEGGGEGRRAGGEEGRGGHCDFSRAGQGRAGSYLLGVAPGCIWVRGGVGEWVAGGGQGSMKTLKS